MVLHRPGCYSLREWRSWSELAPRREGSMRPGCFVRGLQLSVCFTLLRALQTAALEDVPRVREGPSAGRQLAGLEVDVGDTTPACIDRGGKVGPRGWASAVL